MEPPESTSAHRAAPATWLSPRWALPFVLGIGLLTRLLGILRRPIWYDEAFAILFARTGPASMLVGTLTPTGAGSADIHPLGYYTLLWLWMRIFGESLTSVRALSVLAGLGTVLLAYALTRSLFGLPAAFAAGLITALAPFQVHYSQEIRMYSFLGFWLTLAAFCYVRGKTSAGWGWWLGFSASAAMAQYTHNLAVAYLIPLAAWPLLRRQWGNLWHIALASLLAILLYVPWLVKVPAQFAKVSAAYWIQRPGLDRLLTLALAFVTNVPVPPPLLGLALFSALGVLGLGIAAFVRGARDDPERHQSALWLLYMSFAPPLLLFVFSQWKPVYIERALIASGVMFCLWLGRQLASESIPGPARGMLLALIVVGFAIGLEQHLAYRGFPYAPFSSIDAAIHSRLRPGDIVLHSSKLSFLPSLYFDAGLPAAYIADLPGSATDTLAPGTQLVLRIHAAPTAATAVSSAPRVWFAIFDQSTEEYVDAGLPRHPQLTELLEKYHVAETLRWDDLTVYLLARDELP